jgi:hypothetical protein
MGVGDIWGMSRVGSQSTTSDSRVNGRVPRPRDDLRQRSLAGWLRGTNLLLRTSVVEGAWQR